jgi:hemerythrin
MVWSDRLSAGVAAIDEDHKHLVDMLNELYDAIESGSSREILGNLLDRLVDYTQMHFEHEEALLEQVHYPDLEVHRHEHEVAKGEILKLRERFRTGSMVAPSLELVNYLKDWLFDHIIDADRETFPHLRNARLSPKNAD